MTELTRPQTVKMIKELKNASRLHANQAKRLEKTLKKNKKK
jgi:hypothetical protein|tara:strand:+ start:504 stop:626 length:123 start_codon:yes stop_codon:yes gene_type:complete